MNSYQMVLHRPVELALHSGKLDDNLEMALAARDDEDGVLVTTGERCWFTVHRRTNWSFAYSGPEGDVELFRQASFGGKRDDGHKRVRRARFHAVVDATPACGGTADGDRLARGQPVARDRTSEMETALIGVFEDQHPADEEGNGLLGWDAEDGSASGDARDFACGPTAAGVVVIAVSVEEEDVLLNAIEAEERLGVAIGDEAEDGASIGVGAAYVGDDADGGGSVGTHAVDDGIGLFGGEDVGPEELSIAAVGPLLLAGALLLHGFAEGHFGTGQDGDVGGRLVVAGVGFDAGGEGLLELGGATGPIGG
jgi:hypothetical protein